MNTIRFPFALILALTASTVPSIGYGAALDEDPYVPDPGFNNGQYIADDFGLFSRHQVGQRLARLPNGDVIVAGPAEATTMPVPNTMNNIGLVRYDSSGQRVAWSNPTPAFSHGDGNWLIYPNIAGATYKDVKEVVVTDSHVFVLANLQINANDAAVHIIVFGLDGQFVANSAPFNSALLDEFGAGLIYYETGNLPMQRHLLVVASAREVNNAAAPLRTLTRHYHVAADGSLSPTASAVAVHIPGVCAPSTSNTCQPLRVARSQAHFPLDSGSPRFYIAGLYQATPGDRDMFVMRVFSDGSADTSFGANGFAQLAFSAATRPVPDEYATGIAIRSIGLTTDEIYVSGRVVLACRDGGGVFRLHHDGTRNFDFATFGALLFGGSNAASGSLACSLNPKGHYPEGLAIDGDRLAMGGYAFRPRPTVCPSCEDEIDAQLVVVDAEDGTVLDHRELPYPLTGPRELWSVLWDIRAGAPGTGIFTLAGNLAPIADTPLNRWKFGTLRVRADRLFGNGFD